MQRNQEVSSTLRTLLASASSRALDQLLGSWKSSVFGQGLEMAEIRPFSPGDNPVAAVWNRFAQTGVLYSKVFQEERGRIVYLALDRTGSMFQGSGTCARFAQELYSLLVWVTTTAREKVGALIATSECIKVLPPQTGHSHEELMLESAHIMPGKPQGASLARFLCQEAGRELKKSFLIYISDFLEPGIDWKTLFLQLGHRHEVLLLQIMDVEEEKAFSSALGVSCIDPEAQEASSRCICSSMVQKRARLCEQERVRVCVAAKAAAMPLYRMDASQACLPQLIDVLMKKKQGMRV